MDVESLLEKRLILSFTDDVTSLYAAEKRPPPLKMDSSTERLHHYLKVSTPGSVIPKIVRTTLDKLFCVGLTPFFRN